MVEERFCSLELTTKHTHFLSTNLAFVICVEGLLASSFEGSLKKSYFCRSVDKNYCTHEPIRVLFFFYFNMILCDREICRHNVGIIMNKPNDLWI